MDRFTLVEVDAEWNLMAIGLRLDRIADVTSCSDWTLHRGGGVCGEVSHCVGALIHTITTWETLRIVTYMYVAHPKFRCAESH